MKSAIIFIPVVYFPEETGFRRLIQIINIFPTIIVDNGGMGEIKTKNVEIIRNSKNVGYGAGANVGILKAIEKGAKWVVVLNQDVELTGEGLKLFVKELKILSPGVVGPVVGRLDFRRWTTSLGNVKEKYQYISGSFFAIHTDIIKKIGFFFEPYFLYYEDVDLCIRALKARYTISKVQIPGFNHDESLSIIRNSYQHQYYLARNHLLFVERCAPWSVKLYEFIRLPKTLIEHIIRNEVGSFQGVLDYLLRKFGPIKKERIY